MGKLVYTSARFVRKKKVYPPDHSARPNEITMKEWRRREAFRLGVGESAIATRILRGGYQDLKTRRFNQRVVFVQVEG